MDETPLKYCNIAVTNGDLYATYLYVGSSVEGEFIHDENVSDWSDDEIKECVSDMIGCGLEELDGVEVVWA